MSVLLHVSDPHFGTERPAVMQALLAFARQQAPALAVWSGDITQRAHAAQFAAARRFMDAMALPQLVIPGNHDIPLFNPYARLFAPYANFRAAFGEELEPVQETPDFLVIGLNTTRPWHHRDGEVSAAQIATTAMRLAQARPGQLRIVVVHQPLAVITPRDRHNLLQGHDAALQAWREADLFLGGHIHLPYVCPVADAGAASVSRWVVQAGTAVSRRTRDGIDNSVNLLRHDARAGECHIERWDFSADSQAFLLAATTTAILRHR
jgi:3',5'-cyclic AMP phosphodiesterase CpdA